MSAEGGPPTQREPATTSAEADAAGTSAQPTAASRRGHWDGLHLPHLRWYSWALIVAVAASALETIMGHSNDTGWVYWYGEGILLGRNLIISIAIGGFVAFIWRLSQPR